MRHFKISDLLAGVVALAVSGIGWWALRVDPILPETAVFGLYRERWFVLNVVATYAIVGGTALWVVRPSRLTLFKIAAVHVGVAFIIICVESVAILGLVNFREVLNSPRAMDAKQSAPPDARLRFATLPGLSSSGAVDPSFKHIMGLDAEPIPFEFQTDSHGFRNPVEKPDPKLIFIGDSMIVAGLVPIAEITTELIEARLGVTVLNAAEVAYSPQEEIIRLQALDMDLAGRVVLQFFFEGNDLADSRKWRAWQTRQIETKWPRSGLVKNLLGMLHRPKPSVRDRRYGNFATSGDSEQRVYFWLDGKSSGSYMSEMPTVQAYISEFNRTVVEQGGVYGLVFVPAKITAMYPYCTWPSISDLKDPETWTSPIPAALESFAKRESIPFLDPTPKFHDFAAAGKLTYFAKDEHMNANGQAALAEALTPWVREILGEMDARAASAADSRNMADTVAAD